MDNPNQLISKINWEIEGLDEGGQWWPLSTLWGRSHIVPKLKAWQATNLEQGLGYTAFRVVRIETITKVVHEEEFYVTVKGDEVRETDRSVGVVGPGHQTIRQVEDCN